MYNSSFWCVVGVLQNMARVIISRSGNGKRLKNEQKEKRQQKKSCSSAHNKNQKINRWSEKNLEGAIREFREKDGKVPLRFLARAWNVPRSTLKLRFDGKIEGIKHMSGRKPVLSNKSEAELVSVIKELAQRGFPLGMKEVRAIAYSYAQQNCIHGFSDKKQKAGYEWFYGFLKRYPDIGIRKPEALSVARGMGMNQTVLNGWFDQLEAAVDQLGIRMMPGHFWNVDESGLKDHFIPEKIVGEVGKPCYQSTSGEKGETTTIVAAFNAMGCYVKPMVIMKGKRMKPEWLDGLPQDFSIMLRLSENGWINKESFMAWGETFVSQLPKDSSLPHVLFMDGHGSHIYNMQFMELMKKNNVHVWCLPAHTTHWLQPADRSLFRSLKHYWTEEGLKRSRISAASKLTKVEFMQVFAAAWRKSANVENAMSGFCSTGLFPLDCNKVKPEAFLPSKTTERELTSQAQ